MATTGLLPKSRCHLHLCRQVYAVAELGSRPASHRRHLWHRAWRSDGGVCSDANLTSSRTISPTHILPRCRRSSTKSTPRRTAWPGESDEAAQERARWVKWFKQSNITNEAISSTFTRSSGPGGQNVNKLSTKANVRLDLAHASAVSVSGWNHCYEDDVQDSGNIAAQRAWLLASVAGRLITDSQYYVASSHSLLVTSMATRSREANLEDAKAKLHEHILSIASTSLPTLDADRDTDAARAQADKIAQLERREGAKMRKVKERRGGVKQGRKAGRGGGGVWD